MYIVDSTVDIVIKRKKFLSKREIIIVQSTYRSIMLGLFIRNLAYRSCTASAAVNIKVIKGNLIKSIVTSDNKHEFQAYHTIKQRA